MLASPVEGQSGLQNFIARTASLASSIGAGTVEV
jgi:hypothetical protein